MNKMKRLLILLLALLMLLPLVVACKKKEPDAGESDSGSGDSGSGDSVSESETGKYDVYDDLGEFDLGGRTISIGQSYEEDYSDEVDPDRMTGDVINDAVYKRNGAVEKRMNIQIKKIVADGDGYKVVNNLETGMMSGQKPYDLILNSSYMTCSAVTRGLFNDLKKVENLNLSKVYWSPLLNETYTIGGVQYVATGAVSTSFYKFMFVNLLNERVLAEAEGETPDIIGIVKEGKWTMEYQTQLIKNYYVDLGVTGKDEDDKLGFVGNTGIMFDAYLSSGDVQVLKKGADGYYTYDFDYTRATAVMEDLVKLVTARETYCYTNNGSMEEDMLKKFSSGTALLSGARLIHLEGQQMKQMQDKYIILPVAKWSESQENYYSLISDRFTAMAMPSLVAGDDVALMGAVMEALASESYRTVTPVYFETVLRSRLSSSPENWEILQNITENVKMDACLPYTAALRMEGHVRDSIVKLWRYTAWQGYIGTPKAISSVYNQGVADSIEELLNGEKGLQTYIKEQLNKT